MELFFMPVNVDLLPKFIPAQKKGYSFHCIL